MSVIDDVTVRIAEPDDASAIARVYRDTWRATYAGILPDKYLAALTLQRLTPQWRKQLRDRDGIILVACAGDDVVGFTSGGFESGFDPFFRGEIATLYVRPDAQRCGVGAMLLVEMLRELAAAALAPVLVWVLEENAGARAFYEALGALPVRRAIETVGGRDVVKIGYAYFDV